MSDSAQVRDRVSCHDLVLERTPESFFEGFMLGNGDLGAVLWFAGDVMVLSLDKADVWERRADQSLEPGMDFRKALRQARDGSFDPLSRLFDKTRPPDRVYGQKLPVGRVEWQLPERPQAMRGQLRIYDATLSIEVVFTTGTLSLRGYLHALENRVHLELQCNGGLTIPQGRARTRCLDDGPSRSRLEVWGYPPAEHGEAGPDSFASQVFSGDERYTICARRRQWGAHRGACEVTVVTGEAIQDQVAVASARLEGPADRVAHEAWWADFWGRSQLSVPDAALERLWHLEMYKLGCTARERGYPVTIMGVWNPDTRLPPCYGDLHHNLETEMNYWPVFASNHLELAAPLYEMLVRELPRFRQNCRTFFGWDGAHVPANMDIHGQGVGFLWYPWNLQFGVGAWLAQHFWLHYLYSADEGFLRERAWPYMEAVGRFWLGFLEPDGQGALHVPWSYSPEYDDIVRKGSDSAFDLALVRWLLTTLVEAGARLGLGDGQVAPYRQALGRLAPLPVDATGIQVYAGVPLAHSHRHFSHLMAIHPLGFVNVEGSDADRELIDRCLAHVRRKGMGNWAGWSFPWAALLACRARRPQMAYAMLRFYTDHVVLPNTFQVSVDWKGTGFYTAEHGVINTLEAGTGAAAAVMELLLQSWGGRIRLFPCVPPEWDRAGFDTLRAEGAFLVSACYKDGRVAWARVRSEAGYRCVVANPWEESVAQLRDLGDGAVMVLRGRDLEFATRVGGEYELTECAPGGVARGRARFGRLPRWD